MGDVKLAAMMGLFLGSAVAPGVLIALVAGTLVGAVIIARKGASAGRKTAVPFGPFLALGAIVAIFAGQPLVDVYVNHFLAPTKAPTAPRRYPPAGDPPATSKPFAQRCSLCPTSSSPPPNLKLSHPSGLGSAGAPAPTSSASTSSPASSPPCRRA